MELSDIGIKEFTSEELMGGMDKHHIVFKSQGGVNHRYNLIQMPHGFHIGSRGPHRNHELDIKLKKLQQDQLFRLFGNNQLYTLDAIFAIIHPARKKDKKKIEKALQWKIAGWVEGKKSTPLYNSEEIVRTLMGGRLF